MMTRLRNLLHNGKVIAAVVIAIGLFVMVVYSVRTVRSYRQVRFAREQGLQSGTASVQAIRPWMTFRYVSVAYGVPEEYLFAQLDIPFERRNSNETLGELNRKYDFGPPLPPETAEAPEAPQAPTVPAAPTAPADDQGPTLPIVPLIQKAILDYQANPVATGLDDIRPWMTIRYIANSTGIPEEYILEQMGIVNEQDNIFKPLDILARDANYEGGLRRLVEKMTDILKQYEVEE